MRYILITFIFFGLPPKGVTQLPPALNVTVYNETNGISKGRVSALLQAKNGLLWFGATNGLLSYDGYAFRSYNDPAIVNTITRLAEDSTHCIWMSFLGGGLACFNPATGIFKNYTVHTTHDAALAAGEVELLYFDSKGQLWITVTRKGLIKADIQQDTFCVFNVIAEKSTFYPPEFRKIYNSVYDIHEDSTGLLWLATHDGLYQFNPTTELMTPIREKPLQKNMVRYDLFGKIIADKEMLWLCAWAGGLSGYNTKTNKWVRYLPDADKTYNNLHNIITSMAVKNKNELWIPYYKGLGVFNKITKQFFFYNHKDNPNLTSLDGANIITDKDDNVWCITKEGLVKIQVLDYKFVFTPVKASRHNAEKFSIVDMWEDANWQLIGTIYADGLHILNKRTGKTTVLPVAMLPNEEQEMHVRHIFKDSRQTFWIVSKDFIYQYDTLLNRLIKILQPPVYSTDKPSNSFTHATEDKEGNIWFTTRRNGVFMYNTAKKTYTHYSNNTTDAAHFTDATFLIDAATDVEGRVWLGSPNGFLGYVDPTTKKMIPLKNGEGIAPKLTATQTFSLLADSKGDIWVGTYNGLCYFDCHSPTPLLQKIFRAKDGLGANSIEGVEEDAYGNIWCNTGTGVSMVHRKDNHISSFGAQDGIIEKDYIEIVKGLNDTLRLLSLNGYYSLDYHRLQPKEKTVPLIITRMMVNDKDYYYKNKMENGRINLSPSQNVISFEFAAIDFNRSVNQQYNYMLEGFDKDWIDADNRRFVSYTNIPGGNYTFKVEAFTEGDAVKKSSISIPLFIQTPFYKTFLFYLVIAGLLSAFLYWLYRKRMNHQLQVHELQSKTQSLEKEKALVMFEGLKQQLNPHFLFNSLTSLSGLIQSDQKMAGNFLEQMSKIYRYILKNGESTTVFLSAEIKFVTNYVQLQQTRFKRGLQVYINVEEDYDYRKIVPVTLQNLIENAIKHNIVDVDTPLIIDIFCEEEYLIVKNTLQKKTFVETSNKQGLANMQSLYKYLTEKPIVIQETDHHFIIKIPLL